MPVCCCEVPRHRVKRLARAVAGLAAVEILVEVELLEQLVLGLQRGVLLIELNEIRGGAVSFFLDEADVVLLLEIEHLVFAVAQVFLDLDELLGDRRGDVVALVLTHPFLEIEILLHDRVQIGLRVIRRGADRLQIENRGARLLRDDDVDLDRLQLRMCARERALPRCGALPSSA